MEARDSDYFAAVQEGRRRVNESINVLQGVAGPCYPMLFLKLGVMDWTPVGEEMLHKVVPGKNGLAALVICDGEGNSKTISGWVPEAQAKEFSKSLELKGIPEFPGEVKLPI
ncbi:MAG TPA: hypothetical protein VGR53_11655 [Nitrososphaerales archaeon]|nr:hypothetical protein [Nitrososphaerales archaeon]